MRTAITALVAVGCLALQANLACASPITIVDSSPQTGPTGGVNNPNLSIATFDFGGAEQQLATIDEISIRLTMNDGDTAPGNFDFNDLTLLLDGINTGIALNGFSNGATVSLLIGPQAPNNAAAILAALQADGQLVASIVDSDPNDNFFGNQSLQASAGLVITGQRVPEPASLAVWSLLLLAGALVVWRRRGFVPALNA